jgi:hypothetical protein
MQLKVEVLLAAVVGAFVTLSASATTPSWSYEHPKVLNGEFQIKNACMMPAEGKLSRLGMKGKEGMSKESDDWTTTLANLVEAHLKTAGVQLMPATATGASAASDEEIQQVILQIEQKYSDIAGKLNKKPKDIAKARFTLGDDVALLPCAAKSDVLVFVEGEGQVLTGGKKAMGMLVGGPNSASEATLILTMADAKTGEVIGFARLSNAESFGTKFVDQSEQTFGKALDKQFNRMRIGLYLEKKRH